VRRCAALPVAALLSLHGVPAAADTLLAVQLAINGVTVAHDQWAQRSADGAFWLPADDLARWRLQDGGAPPRRVDGTEWAAVCAVYRCTFDPLGQRLALHGGAHDFAAVRDADAAASRPQPDAVAFGGFLNYESWVTRDSGRHTGGTLLDANASGRFGVLHSGWLLQHAGGRTRSVSLGSWWQHDWHDRALSLTLGHAVSAPAPGRGGFAYAGARLGTDVALDPSLALGWLPRIAGAVDAPTALDVVIDGQLRRRAELSYGPFELPIDKVEAGRHDAELLLAGAGGLQRERQAWYYSPRLLAPGRAEWALEAGRPAPSFDLRSAGDGAPFTSAGMRRGLSPAATVQALAHASRPFALAGGGLVLNAWQWALFDAAAYAERRQDDTGHAHGTRWSAGIEHQSRRVSASLRADRSTLPRKAAGSSAGPVAGQLPLRAGVQAQVALPLDTLVRGASVALQRALGERLDGRRAASSVLHASWRVGNASLSVLGQRSRLPDGRRAELGLLLSMPLGERWDGAFALRRERGATGAPAWQWAAQSRPDFARPDAERDTDWRLAGSGGTSADRRFEVEADSHFAAGSARAAVRADRRGAALQAGWRGALGLADGIGFATRPVRDGLLVVSTPGHADVPVQVDNRPAGRTGPDGRLVVPTLRTLDPVRVAVDAAALPLDALLDHDDARLLAPRRAVAVLAFDVRRPHGAVQVQHADGTWLAPGSTVQFPGAGWADTVIGRGGVLYVGAPADGQPVLIEDRVRGTRCGFALPRADAVDRERVHACAAP
jgi:outer membrane usher protein